MSMLAWILLLYFQVQIWLFTCYHCCEVIVIVLSLLNFVLLYKINCVLAYPWLTNYLIDALQLLLYDNWYYMTCSNHCWHIIYILLVHTLYGLRITIGTCVYISYSDSIYWCLHFLHIPRSEILSNCLSTAEFNFWVLTLFPLQLLPDCVLSLLVIVYLFITEF